MELFGLLAGLVGINIALHVATKKREQRIMNSVARAISQARRDRVARSTRQVKWIIRNMDK